MEWCARACVRVRVCACVSACIRVYVCLSDQSALKVSFAKHGRRANGAGRLRVTRAPSGGHENTHERENVRLCAFVCVCVRVFILVLSILVLLPLHPPTSHDQPARPPCVIPN